MANTWFVMAILVGGSWLITRGLRRDPPFSKSQHVLELLVETIHAQIQEIARTKAGPFVPFVGSIFLFVAVSSIFSVVPNVGTVLLGGFPFYHPPTAVLETTIAMALCVFVAVPLFSLRRLGPIRWLRSYLQPTPVMLPFNLIGDVTRTLALSVRLFGNMMSGAVIGAILFSLAPFFFPVVMQLFGLLTGVIQAYIFAVLAMVYIASASQIENQRERKIDSWTR